MSEDSDICQINLPTDEQVERAALALCIARELDPQGSMEAGPNYAVIHHEQSHAIRLEKEARDILTILLNKDRILGYR